MQSAVPAPGKNRGFTQAPQEPHLPPVQKPHIGTKQLLCWIAQPPGMWSRKGLSVRHRLLAKKAEQQLQRHWVIHRTQQWKGQLQRGSGQYVFMVGQGSATGVNTAKINVLKHYDDFSSLTPQTPCPSFQGEQMDMDRADRLLQKAIS